MKLVSKDDKGKSGIYKITNLLNNKVYIGQSIDLWTRINEGYFQKLPKQKGHNIHLQRAWDKYGEENFTFEIIEYIDDYEKLNEIETYWIKEYKAFNNKYGYNILSEGGSNRGVIMSPETKRKISIANKGENSPHFGKPLSEERRRNISEFNSIEIVQLDLDGNFIREWKSIKDAANHYEINTTPISTVLRKKTVTSCGFIWLYKKEYELLGFDVDKHFELNKTIRSVIQLDKKGNYIKEYRSASQAYKETGVSNILNVCQGNQKTAGGFIWMYKVDYEISGFVNEKYEGKYKSTTTKKRKVIQISLDDNFISSFNSISEASKITGISKQKIGEVCRKVNGRKTTGGYKWIYEEEYNSLTNTK